MRLYVTHPGTGKKIYIKTEARKRVELAQELGSPDFLSEGERFSVNEVTAEPFEKTAPAMALGGVVGVVGGVPGVILGGILGGLFGKLSETDDQEKANSFNRSEHVV